MVHHGSHGWSAPRRLHEVVDTGSTTCPRFVVSSPTLIDKGIEKGVQKTLLRLLLAQRIDDIFDDG